MSARMRQTARDRYKYVSIEDAHLSVGQKVNIFAVVLDYAFPKPTMGTDYICTLRIIDQSHHKNGMAVNVFIDSVEKHPHAAAGDVIHLCCVLVQRHESEVNIVFRKSFSSFALYKGKDGNDFVPYQVSSKFHPGDEDNIYIDKLRKWLVNFKLEEDRSKYPMFREFKEGDHINLVCKILHCCEVAKDQWFIFAWDGTDTPPQTIRSKLEDEINSPLPLRLESLPLPRDLLCNFPTVGSILRITFDRVIVKDHLHLLNNVKWVKFVNMRLGVHAGLWYGVFTQFSKLRYAPAEDFLILERQRLSDERMSLKSGSMSCCFPMPSCVTVLPIKYDHVPYVTIMDVLTHSEVTAKFKCVVRVIAALPWRADQLCAHSGKYRLRLTLEDPTARIHAFVFAEDGETLFDGYPSTDSLTKKLNKLLGVNEFDDGIGSKDTPRNPPWVRVCLKSYYLNEDVWGSRNFRIFDTKIVEV